MKNNRIKTSFGASLTALAFSTILSTTAQAQSCTVPPTCEDLGYDLSASDCTGKKALKCPFDKAKYFCLTEGNEVEINPPALNCEIGDILYSDKTCNAHVNALKTPIGVVFDPTNRLAIGKDTQRLKWSTNTFDIDTVPNITSSTTVTGDYLGKSNTEKIIAYCKENGKDCPAIEYVNTYTTEGTSAGDWYLPALGELNAIYTNKAKLNTALAKIGGTNLNVRWHWSSSEYSSSHAWIVTFQQGAYYNNLNDGRSYPSFYAGDIRNQYKTSFTAGSDNESGGYVRPVLAY